MKKHILRGTILALLAVISGFRCAEAQSVGERPTLPQWQIDAGTRMEFEVASVRPSASGTTFNSTIALIDGRDGIMTGNLFRADAILMPYIAFAYKISDSSQALTIWNQLPDWCKTQFWHIEARADGSPTRDQIRLMMQSLLAARFKLSLQKELKPAKESVLDFIENTKPHPGIRPHVTEDKCVDDPKRRANIHAPTQGTPAPRYCGLSMWKDGGQQHIQIVDASMAEVANYLAGTVASVAGAGANLIPQRGIDASGLAGRYDLDFEFVPQSEDLNGTESAGGPTMTQALKNQLGLRITERKASQEMMAIVHIERPSEN